MSQHGQKRKSNKLILWALLLGSISASTSAADTRSIPVPIVTLYPGDVIEESNLTVKVFSAPPGTWGKYAAEKESIVGRRTSRTLIAGQSIPLIAFRDATAVKRGTATRARFEDDGILITTTLVPLTSGSVGEIIEARQADGGPAVRAEVQQDGSLKVVGQ